MDVASSIRDFSSNVMTGKEKAFVLNWVNANSFQIAEARQEILENLNAADAATNGE